MAEVNGIANILALTLKFACDNFVGSSYLEGLDISTEYGLNKHYNARATH